MEDIQLLKVDKAMEELETREDWSDGEDSSTVIQFYVKLNNPFSSIASFRWYFSLDRN